MDPPSSTLWSRVFLMQVTGMVASFQIGKVPPVLTHLQTELSLSLFMAGWVISSFNVLSMLSGSTAGAFADWWGHRRMIIFGLMCQVAGSLAGSLAQGPNLLLATRLAEGLGYICVAVSAPVLIMRVTLPQDRRLAMGVWGTFMPAGASLMMVLSPWLLGTLGWRGLWQFNSGLLLAFILIFAAITRDYKRTGSGQPLVLRNLLSDMLVVLRAGPPLLFALSFGCFALMFMSMTGFLPILLVESAQIYPGTAAWMAALVMFMNVVGNLIAGYVLQKGMPRHWLLALGSIIMGLCSLGIYDPGLQLAIRYALCLLFAAAGGMIPATTIEGSVSTSPRPGLVATSQGLLMQGGQLGLLTGPPALAAFVSSMGGWTSAPWFMGVFALVGLVLAWGVWRISR
jgi:MFS family permease